MRQLHLDVIMYVALLQLLTVLVSVVALLLLMSAAHVMQTAQMIVLKIALVSGAVEQL